MPDLLTATTAREIVSYAIARCLDEERKLFPSDAEIFDYANKIAKEIARHSKLLKSDLYIPLIPNQLEYSYLAVADHLINVLQIETVTLIDGGVESKPLTYKNKKTFRGETILDGSTTAPRYYTFDAVTLAYWRPVANDTSRLRLQTSRDLMSNEYVGKDMDLPPELWLRYSDYIKFGTVSEMCLARPDIQHLTNIQQNYERLYKQYKDLDLIPKTLDTQQSFMREF